MKFKRQNSFPAATAVFTFALVLITCLPLYAFHVLSFDEMPSHPFDERLSTNWLAAVRDAVPAGCYTNGNFDFSVATNCLALESRRGNAAAQALWGFSIIIQSHSREMNDAGLQLLHGAAEKGDIPAMMNLGYLFEGGQYVRRNYNEAFRWFNQAAELGVAEAQLQVAGCYHYGLGVTPNFSTAAKYYQLAAARTNFVAMKSLGYLLMNGYGIEKNEEKAKYWLLRSATEGRNRRAMNDLAVLCGRNFRDTNAMRESFQWTQKSADLGDPLATYYLAAFYNSGWGVVETNLEKYRFWLARAADMGATDAEFRMGQAYRLGDGVPKDDRASLLWYRKAAAKNHPEALYDLALHFLESRTNSDSLQLANQLMLQAAKMGHREAQFQFAISCFRGDLVVDCDGGEEWLQKAAANGWPKAEYLLFQLYYNGQSLGTNCPAFPMDKNEAIKWLHRAAEHGSLPAQSTLAVMLIRGLDMNQDKVKAEALLRDAAKHGFAQAQNDLGFAILNGDIAAADLVEAGMWCKLASSALDNPKVSERAAINLSNVMRRLNLDEQDEVDRRAMNFRALPIPEMDPKASDWQTNADYQQENGQFGH